MCTPAAGLSEETLFMPQGDKQGPLRSRGGPDCVKRSILPVMSFRMIVHDSPEK